MRTWIRHHPVMKLFSLLLAFVLWLMVRAEQYTEINMTVKVVTKNVPENLVIAGDVEPEVRVQISGPRTRLKQLADHALEPLSIDLAEAKPGVNAFTLYGEDFRKLPRGARVTRLFPQVIRISLDQAEERLVKVEPTFTGTLDEGFELIVHEVIPPYLKIRGARSDLEATPSLKTVPIPLNERRQSFDGLYALRGLRPQWGLDEKRVAVKVTIRERETTNVIPDVPVLVSGSDRSVKLEPKSVALRVKGPAGLVNTLLGEMLSVTVPGDELEAEAVRRKPVRMRLVTPKRQGLEITAIPDHVRVTFLK